MSKTQRKMGNGPLSEALVMQRVSRFVSSADQFGATSKAERLVTGHADLASLIEPARRDRVRLSA